MNYYSTNKQAPEASLEEAVVKGLAPDKGLYMPEYIDTLDEEVIADMKNRSFQEIGCTVAEAFFGDDLDKKTIDSIVTDTLSFETPVVHVEDNIYSLELFHGPTLAFKDVGARFMARLLAHFIHKEGKQKVNVLVATSGDTGSAVANGFLGVPGIHVFVLYPKDKVSPIQESQFTTLGQNITALEIDGTFDDCQALVKSAFMDEELNAQKKLTSANSINIARLIPQSFYYFNAYAQLDKIGKADNLVISVPSGNFGNLTAGLFAYWMGLPVKRFVAANNSNDVFFEYLKTGEYKPRPSIQTLANAMDVGDPSNYARIMDLFSIYDDPYKEICKLIEGHRFSDEDIEFVIRRVFNDDGYLLDPHGSCGFQALIESALKEDETGLFLETAHPAKFKGTVDRILESNVEIPAKLKAFMEGTKQNLSLDNDFEGFKSFLLENAE
jgi:threonine synthase